VDERRDHTMRRPPGGEAALELALPVVKSRAALVRFQSAAGPVDDLVGAADEPVERMNDGAALPRQS